MLVLDTLILASIFGTIVFFVNANNGLYDYLSAVFYLGLIFGIYGYRAYYSNNIQLHPMLLEKLGSEYVDQINAELEQRSLRQLVYKRWFNKIGKSAWPGKL